MWTKALIVIIAVWGCSHPNPNRCCVDEADCMANNIPVGSTCANGLLCRGNQCVAETCSTAAECDPSAPYCVAGMCAGACSDDMQCPGSGEPTGDAFCVSGACVQCRIGMNDCPSTDPVCDANVCRTCKLDTECASGVCDIDAGTCVASSTIRYASPTGNDANDCSQTAPCTATKAIAATDGQHAWVLMAPGSYSEQAMPTPNKIFNLVAVGAAWNTYFTVDAGANISIRGLADATIRCLPSPGTAAMSLVDVAPMALGLTVIAINCTAQIRHSHLTRLQLGATGPDGGTKTSVTIDRTLLTGGALAGPGAVQSGSGLTLRITNSVFEDSTFTASFNPPVDTAAVSIDLEFNTFYSSDTINGSAYCPDYVAPSSVTFTNNIFYAPNLGAGLGAVRRDPSIGGCTLDTNIEYPQPTSIGATALVFDPRMVDPQNGDFHLLVGSPAIDTAKVTSSDPSVDYDGTPRPQGAHLDIGAFEYKP